jgi:hypothetical protein
MNDPSEAQGHKWLATSATGCGQLAAPAGVRQQAAMAAKQL